MTCLMVKQLNINEGIPVILIEKYSSTITIIFDLTFELKICFQTK
jgi:hypothetical protein